MPRAQCIVIRNNKILMVKHKHDKTEWWCLPGGGIELNETPENATLRELYEECNVTGKIIRKTSEWSDNNGGIHITYHVDIGNQIPKLGYDPEIDKTNHVLCDTKWLSINEIPERDRVFLWAAVCKFGV